MVSVDDLVRKMEIIGETLKEFKEDKISKEEFLMSYEILLDQGKEMAISIGEELNRYESNNIELKKGFVDIMKMLSKFEQNYCMFQDGDLESQYSQKGSFEKDIEDYKIRKGLSENQ